MEPRVVAIVVAREGGEHLSRTLRAIDAQTRVPDIVVAVDNGSRGSVSTSLAGFSGTVLTLEHREDFGEAVRRAVASISDSSDTGLLWLLAQDSDPDPTALERLAG
ncbi:MAG: hypothetical protein RLZZ600_11, partial [Actinomycetota bacterium]